MPLTEPLNAGGSQGRTEATGFGVIFTVREAMKELNLRAEETTASVQGFGNVAQHAIQLYQQMGGRVRCVSSWNQAAKAAFSYARPEGIDLRELRAAANRFGDIDADAARKLGYEVLPGEAWIEQEVDLLIPAALENQITAATVQRISPRVKLIAEGANGPTTAEADTILNARGIFVIPDFLANAGGVTCSYFEQVQSNTNYYWTLAEVLGKLDVQMTAAYAAVSELARRRNLTMRDAAHVIAIGRVAQACRDRGWA